MGIISVLLSTALAIDPKYVKVLYRRGTAYAHLNDDELAHQIRVNDRNIDNLLRTTKQCFE